MPICIYMSKHKIVPPNDNELNELLADVNKRVTKKRYYINTYESRIGVLKKRTVYHYDLLVEYGVWYEMQLLIAAGHTKETIKAWLYGFLVASDESKKGGE